MLKYQTFTFVLLYSCSYFTRYSRRHRWQLHIGRPGLQWQGRLETRAMPNLRVRQRHRYVRRGDLRGHDRLPQPSDSPRRVLPRLPRRRYDALILTHRFLSPLPWANRTTHIPHLKCYGKILMDPQHLLPWIFKCDLQASSLMVIHWINFSFGSWSSRPKSRLKASNLIGENQRLSC